MESYIIAVAAV